MLITKHDPQQYQSTQIFLWVHALDQSSLTQTSTQVKHTLKSQISRHSADYFILFRLLQSLQVITFMKVTHVGEKRVPRNLSNKQHVSRYSLPTIRSHSAALVSCCGGAGLVRFALQVNSPPWETRSRLSTRARVVMVPDVIALPTVISPLAVTRLPVSSSHSTIGTFCKPSTVLTVQVRLNICPASMAALLALIETVKSSGTTAEVRKKQ